MQTSLLDFRVVLFLVYKHDKVIAKSVYFLFAVLEGAAGLRLPDRRDLDVGVDGRQVKPICRIACRQLILFSQVILKQVLNKSSNGLSVCYTEQFSTIKTILPFAESFCCDLKFRYVQYFFGLFFTNWLLGSMSVSTFWPTHRFRFGFWNRRFHRDSPRTGFPAFISQALSRFPGYENFCAAVRRKGYSRSSSGVKSSPGAGWKTSNPSRRAVSMFFAPSSMKSVSNGSMPLSSIICRKIVSEGFRSCIS